MNYEEKKYWQEKDNDVYQLVMNIEYYLANPKSVKVKGHQRNFELVKEGLAEALKAHGMGYTLTKTSVDTFYLGDK